MGPTLLSKVSLFTSSSAVPGTGVSTKPRISPPGSTKKEPVMPENTTPDSSELPFDALQAKAAFGRVEAQARALAEKELLRLYLDPKRAALAGLELAKLAALGEVAAAFADLPAKHFDPVHVRLLSDLSWALWHVTVELVDADALTTTVKVTTQVVEEAAQRRNRAFKLLEYHLGDDPQIMTLLDSIRSGTGYFDLAFDCTRLGKLWLEHEAVLSLDPKLFVPGEGSQLLALGERIFVELNGQQAAGTELRDLQQRIWTLLLTSADEVVAAGRFLFRNTSMGARFRSLASAARVGARRATNAVEVVEVSEGVAEG